MLGILSQGGPRSCQQISGFLWTLEILSGLTLARPGGASGQEPCALESFPVGLPYPLPLPVGGLAAIHIVPHRLHLVPGYSLSCQIQLEHELLVQTL